MSIKESILNHEIIFASSDKNVSKLITALKKEQRIIKIAAKIYTTNLNDSPENIIRRNLFYILGKLYPNAVLSYRSAFECRPTEDGHLYLTYEYTKRISLPGIIIHLLEGAGPVEGDYAFMGGLYISGGARAFLENFSQNYNNKGTTKCLSQNVLEEKLESIIQSGGEEELNLLRDSARQLSRQLNMNEEFKKLDSVIGALLATKPSKILSSDIALSRALGEPYDSNRLRLFEVLLTALNNRKFEMFPEKNVTESAFCNFAFFESYFSNYIEGTEFEIDDARQIIDTLTPLPARNADSHDVLGTYYIVSNRKEMSIVPSSAQDLIDILQRRHRLMMSARPETNPGMFKTKNNKAGETHFVDFQQVKGTLKKGYEMYRSMESPFAKAVFMLFMISEVHPFSDGNGRISRIMMNAELTAAGQSKIIIPTVFRTDYLAALRQLTRRDNPDKLINAMLRVRNFSLRITGDNFQGIRAFLEHSNAFATDDDCILKF